MAILRSYIGRRNTIFIWSLKMHLRISKELQHSHVAVEGSDIGWRTGVVYTDMGKPVRRTGPVLGTEQSSVAPSLYLTHNHSVPGASLSRQAPNVPACKPVLFTTHARIILYIRQHISPRSQTASKECDDIADQSNFSEFRS